jgi:hypothetical protein
MAAMTSPFQDKLIGIRADYEAKENRFKEDWPQARLRIRKVFDEAVAVLYGAETAYANGNSSTLRYKHGHLSFKADERRLSVACIRGQEGKEEAEPYDCAFLTRDKIEEEVIQFVSSVLGKHAASRYDTPGEEVLIIP